MDKRNQISSYLPAARGGEKSGGTSPTRGRYGNSSGNQDPNAIYPIESENDAVANYNKYIHNRPSNPRNSPQRTGRDAVSDYADATAPASSRNRRYNPQQHPPRLAYYNDGANRTGDVGAYKNTPRPSSAHNSRRSLVATGGGGGGGRSAYPPTRSGHSSSPGRGSGGARYNDADLVDSRPMSARGPASNPPSSRQRRRERPSGLVVTPGHDEYAYDNHSFDDYEAPAKHDNGYYSVGEPASNRSSVYTPSKNNHRHHRSSSSNRRHRQQGNRGVEVVAASATANARDRSRADRGGAAPVQPAAPAQFLVRVHRVRDAFTDLEEGGKSKPTSYVSVHTTEERGRTGVVADDYNPTFNDEFLFTSSRPDKDAVVVTLVVAAPPSKQPNRLQSNARDKRVAEAIVSLQNLQPGVEKEQWVTLVRHPGTADAYERGEVLLSLVSEAYGRTKVPTEEEEAVYYDEIHDMLVQYAPEELHRLDWFVGNVAREGPEALAQLRAKLIEGSREPVKVRVTVDEVSGLVAADGAPTSVETCYVMLSTRRGSEVTTKTVPYRRRASFDQTFVVTVRNPEVGGVALSVHSAGQKIGETLVGLANVQAGVPKQVRLMIVRAAETGDAAPAGEVTVTLQTEDYSSPHQLSPSREARLRERVLAYLWRYLRDDLHRLDCIVAGVDEDQDAYMEEWSRTIGPETLPKHASLRIRRAHDIFENAGGKPSSGSVSANARCYVRVLCGPRVYRTELATARSGALSFSTPIDITIYDSERDVVTCVLIEETGSTEREVSRVVLGLAGLPRGESIVRSVHLVAHAGTRSARLQGELEVEAAAHDFGISPDKVVPADRHRQLCERLEAVVRRSDPESLHRVPYTIDAAPAGAVEQTVEQRTREYAGDVAAAPMTLRVLGLKEFRKRSDCYVKAYLNGAPILTTLDKRGGVEVKFDIGDHNETTVKLTDAANAVLSFKVGQHHSCKRTTVVARTELALRSMVRGERNTVWMPLFEGSAQHFNPERASDTTHRAKNSGTSSKKRGDGAAIRDNRLPTAHSPYGGGGTSSVPLGQLGVMVQSMAFPGMTVTEYVIPHRGGGARGGSRNGESVSAYEAVTKDVTSLLAKFRPHELAKVQPLIAECGSMRDAHSELRARVCPHPVGATVYVHVEKVELAAPDDRVQEAQCGVAAEVSYGDERQTSRKRREFENDVLNERVGYEAVRLDISAPLQEQSGKNRSAAVTAAPPLAIRLIGVRNGAKSSASAYVAPSRTGRSASSGNGSSRNANNGRSAAHANRESSVSPRRRSLGGANNFVNYLDDSSAIVRQEDAFAATSGAGSPYAYRAKHETNDAAAMNTGSNSSNNIGSASNGGAAAFAHQGEIGFVHLSLRALLSAPLHRVGDTIRVPIVAPAPLASYSQSSRSRSRTAGNARRIVGHVTLRVTLPAFESVPEWLRLAGRGLLSQVEPRFVHYYERRIGAYLRQNNATDLVDFHYRLYERDVASGRWPIALPDWMQALIKRFGPETTNIFGPEPPLPFDPEEREREWETSSQQARLRESAFPPSDTGSYSVGGGGGGDGFSEPGEWIGDTDYYFARGTGRGSGHQGDDNGGAADIYEEESPRHRSKHTTASASSQRRGEAPMASELQPRRTRAASAGKAPAEAGKEPELVYGF